MARKANVQIISLGHAFLQGTRGEAGGAPSKNSLWGVALIGRDLVSFSGRVGGVMKFKAEGKNDQAVLAAIFQDKKNGLGVAVAYKDITKSKQAQEVADALADQYSAAKAAGKVTARKMQYEVAA